jgi:hypothetical protein
MCADVEDVARQPGMAVGGDAGVSQKLLSVAPELMVGITGMPGQNSATSFSIGRISCGSNGDGALVVDLVVGVTLICSSASTRTNVWRTSSIGSPGSTRQLTVARAVCGSALSACPASSLVATQVVRSCALYIGLADNRAAAATSGGSLATARMSAAIAESSSAAERWKKARVVSFSFSGKSKRESRAMPSARR